MATHIDKKTILSVEDDFDIASLIKLLIGSAPVELLAAHDPAHAQELLAHHTPDLILLDVMLPEMNGLDFLAELRQDARFADVPVIVVSVRTDASQRRQARELNVFRYRVKPFAPASLRQDIQDALDVDWSAYW
ncbi:MAG: response regulator [Anaerolineales bacterium]